MSQKNGRNFGNEIAAAVQAEFEHVSSVSDAAETSRPHPLHFLDLTLSRDQSRRWLSWGLEGAFEDVPPEHLIRYLAEMADDVMHIGIDEARTRFIDKLLPRILSNRAPERRAKHALVRPEFGIQNPS